MATTDATTAGSAASSILTSLNTGSGIDTKSLVSSLVEAQFANKRAQLSQRDDALTTQISDTASLLSGINGFAASLASLVKGGSLASQPTTSNPDIIAISALSGAKLNGLSASIEVRQLAAAQTTASSRVADQTAAIGTGSFTLTFGTATIEDGAFTGFTAGGGAPVAIAIDSAHASLDGIAAAINAADAGVSASILTDDSGARLVLKSRTGASQAFTLTASDDSDPSLAQLDVGVGASGTTIGTAAQDAIVALDGIAVSRSTNSFTNLIAGAKIDLVAAAPGTRVAIGSSSPTANISQAVSDFVDTFNQLQAIVKTDTDPATGSLSRDHSVSAIATSLRQLTLTPLVANGPAGAPRTLAELGVATNRDGTLSLDQTRLLNALVTSPDTVEAIFASGTKASGDGLAAALSAIAAQASDTTYGLAGSQKRYTKAQADLADQQAAIDLQASAMSDRLTQQYASMDARVAAYKSTQTFLQNQIDAWNAQDN